ncbi:GGDEF domain-containing protein [Devosia sp. PTR5]|uniref:GGDEF domain-containing protein n=1 Tax=Devosia oryzisoli TaxID=2774138 RepID=A0A927FVE0_9HYPH|nr:diguanylate cyclase [Devosia oryzisoli]MBD8065349.1 GGDEF domain-containing protein [Devosia oryzisoli]
MMDAHGSAAGDSFWGRVRVALTGRATPAEPPRVQPRTEVRRPGKSATLVSENLRKAWHICAGRNVSLCLMALEVDGYGAYHAAYGADAADETMDRLEAVVRSMIKGEARTCVRVGPGNLMLVLPDMPLALGRDLAGKIAKAVRREGLPNRESHAGHVSFSIGLAVTNPVGQPTPSVSEAAVEALQKAQRRGLGRLEIVDLRVREAKENQAA